MNNILEQTEDEKDPWELSPQQEIEMKRRLEEAKRDNYAGENWETVKARLWPTEANDSARFVDEAHDELSPKQQRELDEYERGDEAGEEWHIVKARIWAQQP